MNSKNQILRGFGSAQCVMLSGNPNEPLSLSLIIDLNDDYSKVISGVHYSIARTPFFANSQIPAELDLQLFARLTIFRNLSAPLTALFDPFFDADYIKGTDDTDPLSTAYYKDRANYSQADKVFDVVISKTSWNHYHFSELQFGKADRITAVLTPVYEAFAGAQVATVIFGDYYDGRIARTLGLHGCYGY